VAEQMASTEYMKKLTLSKFMAKLLRHHPKEFGLNIKEGNWVDFNEFCKVVQEYHWAHPSMLDIVHLINTERKRRFELKDGKIRATYGYTHQYNKDEEEENAFTKTSKTLC
jgi:putative RNA 2'-phosphotransferase